MARTLSDVTPPSPPYPPNRLGERIERLLQRVLIGALNAVGNLLSSILTRGFEVLLESVESAAAPRITPIIDMILQTPDLPPQIQQYLNHLKNPTAQADVMGMSGFASSAASSAAGALLAPINRVINYTMDRQLHTARPDLALLYAIYWRVPESRDWMAHSYLDIGWAPSWEPWVQETLRPRLGPMELIDWARRVGQDITSLQPELEKFGYKPEEIARLFKIVEVIPTPTDLISMAVKEAWDEAFAEMVGADQGFGGPWVDWARKMGLSEDFCRRYWRAHWQLPSAQMGFEMLHRGVITDSELDALLKALDISPFWRPKLKSIAYNPYTRVDTRRMFNLGIIDRDGVKRAYLDQGYDDQHAENLTEFTVRDATDTDKEATKSDILAGYASGMLKSEEAIEWLITLDYPRTLAEFYIAKEDAKKANSRKAKRIEAVRKLYVGGEIGVSEATTRLTALNLMSTEISEYLDDWSIERENKIERPSSTQLETFLKQDVIDEADYRNGLKLLGFSSQYIDWFTNSALGEKADAARKADQAAKAEQERLRTARVKSDYALAKARLDADESTLQAAIAETQVAAANRRTRYQSELALAKQTISVAALKADAVADINYLQSQIDDLAAEDKALRETIAQENKAIDSLREAAAKEAVDTDAALAVATDEEEISRLKAALKTYQLETAHSIAQHQVIIGQAEQDLAGLATRETDLRNSIDARQARLASDLEIAERVRSVEDVETEYRRDVAGFTRRLGELRGQLEAIRGQKAQLAVTLQTQLKGGE